MPKPTSNPLSFSATVYAKPAGGRKEPLRCVYLVRRARWLEKRIREAPDRNGVSWDSAEYAELLYVFEALRIPFEPADAQAPADPEPPRISETFVPDERRVRGRYKTGE